MKSSSGEEAKQVKNFGVQLNRVLGLSTQGFYFGAVKCSLQLLLSPVHARQLWVLKPRAATVGLRHAHESLFSKAMCMRAFSEVIPCDVDKIEKAGQA